MCSTGKIGGVTVGSGGSKPEINNKNSTNITNTTFVSSDTLRKEGWFLEEFDSRYASILILRLSLHIFNFQDENHMYIFVRKMHKFIDNCLRYMFFSYKDFIYTLVLYERIVKKEASLIKKKYKYDEKEVFVRIVVSFYISQVYLYDTPLHIKSWYHLYTKFSFIHYDNNHSRNNRFFNIRLDAFRECLMDDVFWFSALINYNTLCKKEDWNRVSKTLYALDKYQKMSFIGGVIITPLKETCKDLEGKIYLKSSLGVGKRAFKETNCGCVSKYIITENEKVKVEYLNIKNSNNNNKENEIEDLLDKKEIYDLSPLTGVYLYRELRNEMKEIRERRGREHFSYICILIPEFKNVVIDTSYRLSHKLMCLEKLNNKNSRIDYDNSIDDPITINNIIRVFYN